MKTTLIICLLAASILFTGCETLVESRHPVRVYEQPHYYNHGPRPDYYDGGYGYRDGRTYERDVIVNNRPDVIVRQQPRVYHRDTRVVVVPQRSARTVVQHHDAPRDTKKKKHHENDHDNR